jgi:acetyl-CoA carboxylase biotin carboxyl carrier protein
MRLVEESGFDELTLEMDGIKLTLRRGAAAESSNAGAAPPAATTGPAAAAPQPTVTDPNIQEVPAPLLGTFYRSPKPGAPPFVEIGATVEEDTVIAIIEVMKLMNSVRAGVRGTVTEILPADGSLVEYGAALLRVRKSG